MKNNIIKYVKGATKIVSGAMFCGLLLSSCVDMDLSPKDSPSEASVWSDPTMAEQVVTGVYKNLNHIPNDPYNMWMDLFTGMMDRDANWSNFGILFGRETTSGDTPVWLWHDNYKFIIRCNDAIENLPKVPGMDATKAARFMAELRVLRAHWYLQLAALYGDVPYYADAIKSVDQAKGSNTPRTEIWNNVVNDVTLAINEPALPNKIAKGDANYGHITKGAAYFVRGKAYLWLKEWAKAEADFRKVGEMGYSLFNDGSGQAYKNLFKLENEQCDEMVFSIQCIAEDGYCNAKERGFGSRATFVSSWNNYLPNPTFVESYENADGSKFNWADYIPEWNNLTAKERRVFFLRDGLTEAEIAKATEDGAKMDLYLPNGNEARIRKAYDNRDPRLNQTIITPYDTYLGGDGVVGYYTLRYPLRSKWKDGEANDLYTDTQAMFYYLFRKFVTEGAENKDTKTGKGNAIDMPVIRYAYVLLGLAEALNEQGKVNEAAEVINQIRNRAGAQPLNSNAATTVAGQDDMRKRIQNEYHWEMVGEDVIYFDILRWGTWKDDKYFQFNAGSAANPVMEYNGLRQMWGQATYHYLWGGDHYNLWPIPLNEIQMNPNIKQNPGW